MTFAASTTLSKPVLALALAEALSFMPMRIHGTTRWLDLAGERFAELLPDLVSWLDRTRATADEHELAIHAVGAVLEFDYMLALVHRDIGEVLDLDNDPETMHRIACDLADGLAAKGDDAISRAFAAVDSVRLRIWEALAATSPVVAHAFAARIVLGSPGLDPKIRYNSRDRISYVGPNDNRKVWLASLFCETKENQQ